MKTIPLSKNKALELTLRRLIKSGDYHPHDRFLSVSRLKADYGVSQATIIQTLDSLEAEGLLYRKKRSGIFISPVSKVRQILIVAKCHRLDSDELNRFSCGLGESTAAAEAGLVTLNCTIKEFEDNAPYLKIVYKNLFAVIFFRCADELEKYNSLLEGNGIFAMFYGSSTNRKHLEGYHLYCYDEQELVFRALDELFKRGYRDISCFSLDSEVFRERTRCYIDWMLKHNLPVVNEKIYHLSAEEDGYAYMLKKLQTSSPPGRAVFCTSNVNMGTGCLQALLHRGFRIPDDVALLGIGDIPTSRLLRPQLATLEIDYLGDSARLVEYFRTAGESGVFPCELGKSSFVFTPGGSI